MATINSIDMPQDSYAPTLSRTLWISGVILVFFILLAMAYGWLFTQGCNLSGGNGGPIRIVTTVIGGIPLMILAGLITLYKPNNRIGWICLWMGFSSIVTPIDILIACNIDGIINIAGIRYIAWVMYSFALFAVLPLHIIFPMIFPTGRFLSPIWRKITVIGLITITILSILEALSPDFTRMNAGGTSYALTNPFGMAWLTDDIVSVLQIANVTLIVGLTLAAIVSLILRFRRSGRDERQQIKWLVYFLAIVGSIQPTIELIGFLGFTAVWDSPLYLIAILALFGGFPIIIGITIFKYRLYDIDIIINRTLVYGGLTVLVAALYLLVVNSLSFMLQSQNVLSSSVIATVLVTVIFQPARDRLQAAVNRLMFGERDNPYAVLSHLGQQLQSTARPSETLKEIVETIAQTLKLPYVAIELIENDMVIGQSATGNPIMETRDIALQYQNEIVGRLQLSQRARDEAFTPQEQQLFADIAAQIAPVASATRLTMALQNSREQLVLAREEERRRIRRDLHDGLGPTLASQTLSLEAISQLMETNPEKAQALIKEVQAQADEAIQDVRRLVYDLRPPALDDLGLVGALEQSILRYENTDLHITLSVVNLPDELAAAIETALYRIAQEALTNIVRHSDATRCTIRLYATNAYIEIEVEDNGRGLPDNYQSGVGLHAMRERASELNGETRIQNHPTGGTIIQARIPLGAHHD